MPRKVSALFGAWKAALFETSRRRLYAAGLPSEPCNDDLYLVEFPKSGITWLTFLVANANLLLAGETHRQVTFFNILDFVPDVHVNRNISPATSHAPGFRCIKSHATYNPYYRKVVYLVRDPRNVMPSLHAFLTKLGWYGGSLEQMIDDSRFGANAWAAHVRSWLDRIHPTHSFLILRYEDLLADTAAQLRTLYRHLGWELDDQLVAKAVERSSLDRMKLEEALFNAANPSLASFSFVRDGRASGPRQEMPPSVVARIEAHAAGEMTRLGYALTTARAKS